MNPWFSYAVGCTAQVLCHKLSIAVNHVVSVAWTLPRMALFEIAGDIEAVKEDNVLRCNPLFFLPALSCLCWAKRPVLRAWRGTTPYPCPFCPEHTQSLYCSRGAKFLCSPGVQINSPLSALRQDTCLEMHRIWGAAFDGQWMRRSGSDGLMPSCLRHTV